MRIATIAAVLTVAGALALAGCSKGDRTSTTTTATDSTASPAADVSPGASAEPSSPLPSDASPGPSGVPSPGASGATAASPGAAPSPLPSVAFTDVHGVQGEREIVQLAQLGVLDASAGEFKPGAPVKRREFVRWLVKANNALFADAPAKQIHLADASEKPDLSDLPASDPDFPYVQGMNDAGIAVGFPDKSFKPDAPLTREQMIAIKSGLDRGGVSSSFQTKNDREHQYARYHLPAWKDRDQVSVTYLPAIATDISDESHDAPIANVGRTFGAIALFRPQQAVTRAQAAVLMSVIGAHDESSQYANAPRSAAQALGPKPSPTP
jgi:hypothetical protein